MSFVPPAAPRPRVWLHLVLFILTALSATLVGFQWAASYLYFEAAGAGLRLPADARVLALGVLYAAALLTILVGHELGHYLTCRRYGIPATLPYFIPAPSLIGTFGAFIKIKAPIGRKRELFDIGANGPLAGFPLALAAVVVGLAFSRVAEFPPTGETIVFGEPLLFRFLSGLILGPLPDSAALVLHPVGFAGWVGLLVTSFNLLPVGQLDGGHIAYAVLGGRRAEALSKFIMAAFIILGVFVWTGWFLWAAVLGLMGHRSRLGLRHPPVADEAVPLDRGRLLRAALCLAIFVLSFIPDPVKGFDLIRLF